MAANRKKVRTFAPAYKKNLTPKFVSTTGTPGDYGAKVGKIIHFSPHLTANFFK